MQCDVRTTVIINCIMHSVSQAIIQTIVGHKQYILQSIQLAVS